MSDKLEALKAKKPADIKSLKSQAAGYVTDDNTGCYYVVEGQEYGEVYPIQQSGGGGQIADTGDCDDSYCPHCGYVDPDECDNVGLVWNVQQAKINALLAALEEANSKNYLTDMLEWRRKAEEVDKRMVTQNRHVCELFDEAKMLRDRAEASGRREEHLKASVDVLSAKNAELQQRLQRSIKLPDVFFIKISGQAVAVMSAIAIKERIRAAGHKVEGE